jgi:transposase
MSRKKYSSNYKTKVVLEALKERESLSVLAQKYELHPQQIGLWKREFLANATTVFEKGTKKNAKTEAQEKEEKLLTIIGEQKVELDFLKKALS